MAARHNPDLVLCRKMPGIGIIPVIGKLCANCDGRCPLCDSYVRPEEAVHICDECNFGPLKDRCIICGAPGVAEAFYCHECCLQEKDRDGCPRIVNMGSARLDFLYARGSGK